MAASISNFSTFPGSLKTSLRLLLRLWLTAGLFCGVADLRADLNSTSAPRIKGKRTPTGISQPTAIADAATAEVRRAGEVTIRLRGIASGGGQVEFQLMQKPMHGKILRSKEVGLDSLDVVYRHSGDASSDTDSFVFAVRAAGIGPFSPGAVRITVMDEPGRLLAPEALNFPATLVGQAASDSFVIVNEGGAVLQGKISVSAPWRLDGAAAYVLNPGARKKITIQFVPQSGGSFTGQVNFEGSGSPGVNLQGDGLGTFLASPLKIKLSPTLDGKRTGIVSLQNNTAEPIVIELESQLDLPKNVALQFGETRELTVTDSGISALLSHVTFRSGAYTARVDVSADEAPARPPAANESAASKSVATAPVPVLVATANAEPALTPPAAQIAEPADAARDAAPEPPVSAQPASPDRIKTYLNATIKRLSSSAIRIEWKIPKETPGAQYGIQQRYLTLKSGKLDQQWVEVPSAKIKSAGDQGTAEIADLDAATVFTFRVVQTSGEPKTRSGSLALNYQTEPGFFRRLTWRSFLFPLAVLLVGLVIRNRWSQRVRYG